MARNKYDIDETLETPFNIAHLKRALVYVKRYKWKMITAFTLSAISAVVALFAPLITKEVVDNAIPMGMNGDEKAIPYIILLASLFFGLLFLLGVLCNLFLSIYQYLVVQRFVNLLLI